MFVLKFLQVLLVVACPYKRVTDATLAHGRAAGAGSVVLKCHHVATQNFDITELIKLIAEWQVG